MAGRLRDELVLPGVVEQEQAALRPQHLGGVTGDLAEEGLGAPGEREGPGHLVEPQQLTRLLLQRALQTELAHEARHAELQLGAMQGLRALHVVRLRRCALRTGAVEDQDPHVVRERAAHVAHDRGHVWERVRDEHHVGRAVHDGLDHVPAGAGEARFVAGALQQTRQLLGTLGVLVDDHHLARRTRGGWRRTHARDPKRSGLILADRRAGRQGLEIENWR